MSDPGSGRMDTPAAADQTGQQALGTSQMAIRDNIKIPISTSSSDVTRSVTGINGETTEIIMNTVSFPKTATTAAAAIEPPAATHIGISTAKTASSGGNGQKEDSVTGSHTGFIPSKLEALRDTVKSPQTEPPLSVKNDPTFLGLPRELRDKIYGLLMTAYRGSEYAPLPKSKIDVCTNLLRVNRQIRNEALTTLKEANIWICLRARHHGSHGKSFLPDIASQQPNISPGIGGDMYLESTLMITLDIAQQPQIGLENYKVHVEKALIAYNPDIFPLLCIKIWEQGSRIASLRMVLSHHPLITSKIIHMKLIEPLSMIRGLREVSLSCTTSNEENERISQMMQCTVTTIDAGNNYLLSFKERGDQAMEAGQFTQAKRHYFFGNCASLELRKRIDAGEATGPKGNLFRSITHDMSRLSCKATNKLVESRRDKDSGKIRGFTTSQLKLAIISGDSSLDWCGILEPQRGRSHYYRGVAYKNLADYDIAYGRRNKALRIYSEAAKDMFYALRLLPKEKVVKQSLEEVDKILGRVTSVEHAPIEVLRCYPTSFVWAGDGRLLDVWGPEGIHTMLFSRLRPE